MEQRMGDKAQRCETANKGRETRNRDVRQGTEKWDREKRIEDKEQRRETENSGRETRKRDVRQEQTMGDKEQTVETGDIGR
jgi:hypothetical protein